MKDLAVEVVGGGGVDGVDLGTALVGDDVVGGLGVFGGIFGGSVFVGDVGGGGVVVVVVILKFTRKTSIRLIPITTRKI